jgi:hypothetical protein
MTIVEFREARLAEDEMTANAAIENAGRTRPPAPCSVGNEQRRTPGSRQAAEHRGEPPALPTPSTTGTGTDPKQASGPPTLRDIRARRPGEMSSKITRISSTMLARLSGRGASGVTGGAGSAQVKSLCEVHAFGPQQGQGLFVFDALCDRFEASRCRSRRGPTRSRVWPARGRRLRRR